MARREPIVPIKLAILVEDDSDKAFFEALVPRVVGPDVSLRIVRVGGKAAFPSTFFEAAQFVEAGYASVFVVVDADTDIFEEIELQKHRLLEVFRRYGLQERVRVFMAVPMLEAWLLAAYEEDPERSVHPKRDLARATAGADIQALAVALPIDLVRRRARSFDDLVTALEAYAPRKARRAS